jgi:hypothetical protein
MAISRPNVGPLDADTIFNPRRLQWETPPAADSHIDQHDFGTPERVQPED